MSAIDSGLLFSSVTAIVETVAAGRVGLMLLGASGFGLLVAFVSHILLRPGVDARPRGHAFRDVGSRLRTAFGALAHVSG